MSSDTQAVLATDKVRFQGQEVAFVVAEDRYAARDALELIDVELRAAGGRRRRSPRTRRRRARDPRRPWTAGATTGSSTGRRATARRPGQVFADADVVVEQEMVFPRSHPAPLETCGAVADYDRVSGKLTIHSHDPGAPRPPDAVCARILGVPEHKIRVISPDIGGGFGNKVPMYPGYVCAVVGGDDRSGGPVKWMEDRSENLMSTGFARDYLMRGAIAATREGRILRRARRRRSPTMARSSTTAQPTKFPAGFFHVFTGSYDIEAAHCEVRGVYTNKAPGGVAYACSFRIAEAVYLVERLVDCLAARARGSTRPELRLAEPDRAGPVPVPVQDRAGCMTPATTRAPLRKTLADRRLRRAARASRPQKRAAGRADGDRAVVLHRGGRRRPAQATWTSSDSGMNDGASLRVLPTGTAQLAISVQTQGQGHETTFAQIVAHELGIPPEDVDVDPRRHRHRRRTVSAPTAHARRPSAAPPTALVARKVRDRARLVASAMLEVAPDDLEWESAAGNRRARWFVKGDPEQGATIQEIAMAARGSVQLPEGVEAGLDAESRVRPAEPDLPVRCLPVRRRHRSGDREGDGAPVRRGRRLR